MAYDGLSMAAVCKELQPLVEGRIEKIYQPQKELVVLHLRQKNGSRCRLLLCAEASSPRVHLTEQTFTNPSTPPMFCMLLRKYLEGGRILSITQQGVERILVITIQTYNELRELCERQLICEIMGKHSNVILVNPDTKLILDGIKRYTHAVSRHREVLPGRTYIAPPPQHKKNPLHLSYEEMEQGLLEQLGRTLSRAFVNLLDGVSPLLGKELVARADLPLDFRVDGCGAYEFQKLFEAIRGLRDELDAGCPTPSLAKRGTDFYAFSAFKLNQYPEDHLHHLLTVNETIDTYHQAKKAQELFLRSQQRLTQLIRKELDRCYKKATLQDDTIQLAKEADDFRIKGEILTANLFRVKAGDDVANLENFYDPDGKNIIIELLPELAPSENAQRYFRQYNRAKNAAKKALIHYKETKDEIAYLEAVQHTLEQADTVADLEEIAQELTSQDYLKPPKRKGQAKKPTAKRPELLSFSSSAGFNIFVGRNNRQNDYLTLRVAKDKDLWLHTKDLPGSHVIIENPQGIPIPEETLVEAATLAAYYSKGRQSSKVPIDYTVRKNVRKPGGAKPGMVIYDNHQTLYITPEIEVVEKIKKNNKLG